MMRVAVGGYLIATNTFATQEMSTDLLQKATLRDARVLVAGGRTGAIQGFVGESERQHWELLPLHFVAPGVGGKMSALAHEAAKADFLDSLRENLPLDGVFLQMHGTAVSEDCDDCEGDLLKNIRKVVGEDVPIVVVLDGHSNTTPLMVEQSSAIIGVKTNPHDDFFECGTRAAKIMGGVFDGGVSVETAWSQPAMAPALQKIYVAPGWPMESLARKVATLERDKRVLDITLAGGFFCSDILETGMSVVVTTNREKALAEDIADQVRQACWSKRHQFLSELVSVEEGVREAIEAKVGPVVLGDLADSGGAGTPGDGTAVLAEFIEQKAKGAVIGNIVDPEAVRLAVEAGVGKNVDLTVGGKVDRFHGSPLEIIGKVRAIHEGTYRASTSFNAGVYRRGLTVVLACDGIEVILTSRPTHGFEANHFRSLGIEPQDRKILAVKSELQHRAGFAGIASKIIDLDTPGLATQVHSRLPYKKIRRPIFPLDES